MPARAISSARSASIRRSVDYEAGGREFDVLLRESKEGQLLEEGITEAGALSSWSRPPPPTASMASQCCGYYIFYSMFGFQRIGDLIWAAAEGGAFLIGATPVRHDAGGRRAAAPGRFKPFARRDNSQLPHYDPGFRIRNRRDPRSRRALDGGAGRGRVLLHYRDEQNYNQPSKPEMAERALSMVSTSSAWYGPKERSRFVRLLGSGISPEVVEAGKMLDAEWDVAAEVWSATSYSELARDARNATTNSIRSRSRS